jgi:ABC-type branched-subunit amino acid transport system ATPase component
VNVLTATEIRVRFGGVVAVDGVDLVVDAGEVVGLIGPNGSGKTTLLDAICGFEAYDGSVRLDQHSLDGLAPHRRARLGLARTFQALELLDDLTVSENIGASGNALTAALAFVGASHLASTPVEDLANAPRRRVALARALARDPRVLLVDEVAAGLDTAERTTIAGVLRSVADSGVGVVLVDHDLDLVLGVADRVVVLDHGRVIADAPPAAVRDDPAVIGAYLGTGP